MKLRFVLFFAGIFFFFASLSSAQSLQVLDKSGNDVSGTVITAWGDTTNVISVYFDLKNISGGTVHAKAKKIENSLQSGAKVTMCFAGHCYLSGTYVTPFQDTIETGGLDTTFIGDYKAYGAFGASLITFVFFRTDNPDDSAFVIVQYNATPMGIEQSIEPVFEISSPYPNPASSQISFDYSFPEYSSANFTLSDITGNKIKEVPVYDSKGTLEISTDELSEGMYFYSFYLDGKMLMTKKLIIQK